MTNVHIDPSFDDEERRRRLMAGDVIIYSQIPEVVDFPAFTRELVTEALTPDEPTTVHTRRSPDELADVLIDFKPRFTHHSESTAYVRRIVTALAVPEQVHASGPNTSDVMRYSIDFSTVNTTDVHSGTGAPCTDVRSVGTKVFVPH